MIEKCKLRPLAVILIFLKKKRACAPQNSIFCNFFELSDSYALTDFRNGLPVPNLVENEYKKP